MPKQTKVKSPPLKGGESEKPKRRSFNKSKSEAKSGHENKKDKLPNDESESENGERQKNHPEPVLVTPKHKHGLERMKQKPESDLAERVGEREGNIAETHKDGRG